MNLPPWGGMGAHAPSNSVRATVTDNNIINFFTNLLRFLVNAFKDLVNLLCETLGFL